MKKLVLKGNWLVTLPLALLGIGYLYFFFLPAKAEIERLHAELKLRQAAITQAQPMKLAIYENEQELETTKQLINERFAPRNQDAASVMAAISDQVQQSGLQTLRFDPQTVIRHHTLKKAPLVLGTEGSFAEIFDMLHRLENLDANVWMDYCHIELSKEGGEKLANEVTLAIFADNPDISD